MKETNNFYPKTWLKKYWEFNISIEPNNKWKIILIRNEWGSIVVTTNGHYKVLSITRSDNYNKWLYQSLIIHLKKWGLIAW